MIKKISCLILLYSVIDWISNSFSKDSKIKNVSNLINGNLSHWSKFSNEHWHEHKNKQLECDENSVGYQYDMEQIGLNILNQFRWTALLGYHSRAFWGHFTAEKLLPVFEVKGRLSTAAVQEAWDSFHSVASIVSRRCERIVFVYIFNNFSESNSQHVLHIALLDEQDQEEN